MLVGLDFDNTIANYDSLFREIGLELNIISQDWKGNKKDLRNLILTNPEGEEIWMKIQGKVYGEYMHRAKLTPGVANFLLQCKAKKIEVCIISHKTEYGHYDKKNISLRKEATKWMFEKNLFDNSFTSLSKNNVFFENTRKEKVTRISKIGCSHFVDDLPEVFEEPNFPKNTKKILFG